MNTMELEATRKDIFRSILDENNEYVLSKMAKYLRKIKVTANEITPCCFTNEEKLTRIEQSVLDAQAGLGITHEEMFNRHPEWL